MKKDYCQYFVDKKGRPWFKSILCKGCGEKIQDSHLMKDGEGIEIPVMFDLPNYVDMYVSFEDENGQLRRRSTPMCENCTCSNWDEEELQEQFEIDHTQKRSHYELLCRCEALPENNKDEQVEAYLNRREKSVMKKKIGYAVYGYALTGEGK